MRAILATYEEASRVPGGEAWDVEARAAAAFQRGGVDPADIERRRQGVVGPGPLPGLTPRRSWTNRGGGEDSTR